MARKQTTKGSDADETALATIDADAALAELSDFFDEVGVDGLEDFSGEDIKLAVLLWNLRPNTKDKSGEGMRKDRFFNTVTEESCDSIDLVFLVSKKTKRYDRFDNALDKTIVLCESRDRITGTTRAHPDIAENTERPCKGCPDDGWFTNADGNPVRRCGEVHNLVAIERLTQRPIAIRFKKTGLKPWRQYASAYHYGGRVKLDKSGRKVRANVPLFCYVVRLSLKLAENGNYATPIFEPVEQGRDKNGNGVYLMPRDEVLTYGEYARDYVEIMSEVLNVADAHTAAHDTSEGGDRDDNLSADDFKD